jgi:hypothetical protein
MASPETEIPVTKVDAAMGQLETAIVLWFHEGNPVAIHTLAVAADDCLNSLKRHKTNTPSAIRSAIKTLPRKIQNAWHESQNFFKHGDKELRRTLRFFPIFTDLILMNAVISHASLGDGPTSLTIAFLFRFQMEQPVFAAPLKDAYKPLYEMFTIDLSEELTRLQFFEKYFPRIEHIMALPVILNGPIA